MCLRSNCKILYYTMILYAIPIFFTATCIIASRIRDNKSMVIISLFLGLILLVVILDLLKIWIAFGREIRLTEEGCVVKFLCFTKLYRWDQMKTKRRMRIDVGGLSSGLFYKGLVLSCKKVRFIESRSHLDMAIKVPTFHPFSLIFILFEPDLASHVQSSRWTSKKMKLEKKKEIHSGYFADEEELFSLLNSWRVSVDGKWPASM